MKNTPLNQPHQCVTEEEVLNFLDNAMTETQKQAFQAKLAGCEKCRLYAEGIRLQRMATQASQESEIQQVVDSLDYETMLANIQQHNQTATTRSLRRRSFIGIAASIIVIMGIMLGWRYWPSDSISTIKSNIADPDTLQHQTPPRGVESFPRLKKLGGGNETVDSANQNKPPQVVQKNTTQDASQNRPDDMPNLPSISPQMRMIAQRRIAGLEKGIGEKRYRGANVDIESPTHQAHITGNNMLFLVQVKPDITGTFPKLWINVYDSSQAWKDPIIEEQFLIKSPEEPQLFYFKHKLPKGTYYWKLLSEKGEYFKGKFFFDH